MCPPLPTPLQHLSGRRTHSRSWGTWSGKYLRLAKLKGETLHRVALLISWTGTDCTCHTPAPQQEPGGRLDGAGMAPAPLNQLIMEIKSKYMGNGLTSNAPPMLYPGQTYCGVGPPRGTRAGPGSLA